jgi:hypothetical protein
MQHRSSFGASSCPLSRGPRLTHFDIRFIYSNKNFLLIPASKLGRPTSLTRLVSSSKPLDFITKNSDLRVAQDPDPSTLSAKSIKKARICGRFLGPAAITRRVIVLLFFSIFLQSFLAFFASSFSGVESRLNVPPLHEPSTAWQIILRFY